MSIRMRRSTIKPLVVTALAAAAVLAPVNAYAAPGAASAASAAVVVKSGQRLDIGHGLWLTLTASQVCEGGGQVVENCSSVTNGNQAPDSVSLQTSGDTSGTMYRALYLGSGAARMTVQAGPDSYRLRLVTLAGDHGYAVGYGWGAPQTQPPGDIGATVYSAAGAVLATL